jgi:uncharacterized protein YgiM (DUF1202 family)
MKKLIPIFLCTLMAACNFPASRENINLNDEAGTAVALTLAAKSTEAPEETDTPPSTSTVDTTPGPTITPTYSVPMLNVSENTNCRSGPGQNFDILITILAGKSVEIVGKHESDNYWVVKVDGMDTPCWIWGEFSSATGSHWTVPVMTPPTTQAPNSPEAPSIANWEYTCASGNVNVTIKWNDRADNESGYRIYRNDEMVAELPPNSNSFTEVIQAEDDEELTYRIEVFNEAGTSSSSLINFSCQ